MTSLDLFVPHRPPFRLVDRLRSNEGGTAVGEKVVTNDDPLVHGVLAPIFLIEALAQTAAAIAGGEVGQHRGMLVALKDVRVDSEAVPGDVLELVATRTGTLGSLHRVTATARVGERVILSGEMTFAIEAR
jgi:3-hydroxyacyl-[acyl-carrier-protein] dehydratase